MAPDNLTGLGPAEPEPRHPDWVAFKHAERSPHKEPRCFYPATRFCANCWYYFEFSVVKGESATTALALGVYCPRCNFKVEL